MTDAEIFDAIGRGCCTEQKAIENGCAVCAPMYEAVAIVRKRFAELEDARSYAATSAETANAAWAELAGVAQILGYERATAEDFGEVDVVDVRALALTTVAGRREARISAAERLRDLKAIGEAINRCGLMVPEERFQLTPCEHTVAAVEQLREERDDAKKKLATLANAVAESDRVFKLWLDHQASDAQLQAADDALAAAREQS